MASKKLLWVWGALFIVCAVLGLIRQSEDLSQLLLTLCALIFFLPPAVLAYRAKKKGDEPLRKLLRNLSALSLGMTVVLLIANFLSFTASEKLGGFLNTMLAVISTPMFCMDTWAPSIFLWACLLVGTLGGKKKG